MGVATPTLTWRPLPRSPSSFGRDYPATSPVGDRQAQAISSERIDANDLLHLVSQALESGPQIDRPACEKDLCSRGLADLPGPHTADSTPASGVIDDGGLAVQKQAR